MSFTLDGWGLAIAALAFVVAMFALVWFVGHSIARAQQEVRRQRLLTIFHLPDDAMHAEPVRRYMRLVRRGEVIGFLASGLVLLGVVLLIGHIVSVDTRDKETLGTSRQAAQLGVQFAFWYTASMFGGAIGAATAMRVHRGERARASLAVRDVSSFVPPACVRATFVIGPIAAVAALGFLIARPANAYERFYLIVAIVVAILAMAVLIPLANRLAQMPMPIDGKRDAALDEALRHVSARMIGGDALLMAACAAAVTISLLMPTYQSSLIALMVVVLPAAYVANALQPGNFVPRSLLRWLDGPRPANP